MSRIETVSSVPVLRRRRPDGHKGDYGRVLIVGGSRGMIGAVALSARAALRGGAGLVTFAAPGPVQLTIAGLCPCATSIPLACRPGTDELAAEAVAQVCHAAAGSDVLAVGPGMGVGTAQQNLVRAVLGLDRPLVLDADALSNLAKVADWSALRTGPLVLTPHPGEFARLTGLTVADIQADRRTAAVSAAREWSGAAEPPLICVLKGAGTLVTDGRRLFVNTTGNPGMATGGTGDVLTGLTAAMIGQGLGRFGAACLAVHCHGRAGDLARQRLGEASVMADDLLAALPAAIMEQAE